MARGLHPSLPKQPGTHPGGRSPLPGGVTGPDADPKNYYMGEKPLAAQWEKFPSPTQGPGIRAAIPEEAWQELPGPTAEEVRQFGKNWPSFQRKDTPPDERVAGAAREWETDFSKEFGEPFSGPSYKETYRWREGGPETPPERPEMDAAAMRVRKKYEEEYTSGRNRNAWLTKLQKENPKWSSEQAETHYEKEVLPQIINTIRTVPIRGLRTHHVPRDGEWVPYERGDETPFMGLFTSEQHRSRPDYAGKPSWSRRRYRDPATGRTVPRGAGIKINPSSHDAIYGGAELENTIGHEMGHAIGHTPAGTTEIRYNDPTKDTDFQKAQAALGLEAFPHMKVPKRYPGPPDRKITAETPHDEDWLEIYTNIIGARANMRRPSGIFSARDMRDFRRVEKTRKKRRVSREEFDRMKSTERRLKRNFGGDWGDLRRAVGKSPLSDEDLATILNQIAVRSQPTQRREEPRRTQPDRMVAESIVDRISDKLNEGKKWDAFKAGVRHPIKNVVGPAQQWALGEPGAVEKGILHPAKNVAAPLQQKVFGEPSQPSPEVLPGGLHGQWSQKDAPAPTAAELETSYYDMVRQAPVPGPYRDVYKDPETQAAWRDLPGPKVAGSIPRSLDVDWPDGYVKDPYGREWLSDFKAQYGQPLEYDYGSRAGVAPGEDRLDPGEFVDISHDPDARIVGSDYTGPDRWRQKFSMTDKDFEDLRNKWKDSYTSGYSREKWEKRLQRENPNWSKDRTSAYYASKVLPNIIKKMETVQFRGATPQQLEHGRWGGKFYSAGGESHQYVRDPLTGRARGPGGSALVNPGALPLSQAETAEHEFAHAVDFPEFRADTDLPGLPIPDRRTETRWQLPKTRRAARERDIKWRKSRQYPEGMSGLQYDDIVAAFPQIEGAPIQTDDPEYKHHRVGSEIYTDLAQAAVWAQRPYTLEDINDLKIVASSRSRPTPNSRLRLPHDIPRGAYTTEWSGAKELKALTAWLDQGAVNRPPGRAVRPDYATPAKEQEVLERISALENKYDRESRGAAERTRKAEERILKNFGLEPSDDLIRAIGETPRTSEELLILLNKIAKASPKAERGAPEQMVAESIVDRISEALGNLNEEQDISEGPLKGIKDRIKDRIPADVRAASKYLTRSDEPSTNKDFTKKEIEFLTKLVQQKSDGGSKDSVAIDYDDWEQSAAAYTPSSIYDTTPGGGECRSAMGKGEAMPGYCYAQGSADPAWSVDPGVTLKRTLGNAVFAKGEDGKYRLTPASGQYDFARPEGTSGPAGEELKQLAKDMRDPTNDQKIYTAARRLMQLYQDKTDYEGYPIDLELDIDDEQ